VVPIKLLGFSPQEGHWKALYRVALRREDMQSARAIRCHHLWIPISIQIPHGHGGDNAGRLIRIQEPIGIGRSISMGENRGLRGHRNRPAGNEAAISLEGQHLAAGGGQQDLEHPIPIQVREHRARLTGPPKIQRET